MEPKGREKSVEQPLPAVNEQAEHLRPEPDALAFRNS